MFHYYVSRALARVIASQGDLMVRHQLSIVVNRVSISHVSARIPATIFIG